jgi:Ca2+/Na+ antiporter
MRRVLYILYGGIVLLSFSIGFSDFSKLTVTSVVMPLLLVALIVVTVRLQKFAKDDVVKKQIDEKMMSAGKIAMLSSCLGGTGLLLFSAFVYMYAQIFSRLDELGYIFLCILTALGILCLAVPLIVLICKLWK